MSLSFRHFINSLTFSSHLFFSSSFYFLYIFFFLLDKRSRGSELEGNGKCIYIYKFSSFLRDLQGIFEDIVIRIESIRGGGTGDNTMGKLFSRNKTYKLNETLSAQYF